MACVSNEEYGKSPNEIETWCICYGGDASLVINGLARKVQVLSGHSYPNVAALVLYK